MSSETHASARDAGISRLLERLASRRHQGAAWSELLERYSPLLMQVARHMERDPDRAADAFLFICEGLGCQRFRRLRQFRPDGPASFSTWLRAVARHLCLDRRRKELGRRRDFRSIARLPCLERKAFQRVYWQGMSTQAAWESLKMNHPDLTLEGMHELLATVASHLTPRQRWLLDTRQPRLVSLHGEGPDRLSPEEAVPASQPGPESLTIEKESEARLAAAMADLEPRDRLLLQLRFEQGLTLAQVARLTDLGNPQRVDRRLRRLLKRLRSRLER